MLTGLLTRRAERCGLSGFAVMVKKAHLIDVAFIAELSRKVRAVAAHILDQSREFIESWAPGMIDQLVELVNASRVGRSSWPPSS